MKDGRPLRFLGGTLGGWALVRVVMLWPNAETAPMQALVRAMLPPVAAQALAISIDAPVVRSAPSHPVVPIVSHGLLPVAATQPIASTTTGRPSAAPATPTIEVVRLLPSPAPIARGPGRIAGSAWLLARGGPSGTLSGGQLGASQAGIRLTYALGKARRVALAVRVATPLSGPGKEAALGIEWQPTRLPVRLIAEQRFVLDGGRGGPTVGVVGGYGPALVAPGLRLEAYGQAGAIARDGIEGFVDAAARVTHPIVGHGPIRIDIGAGVWGSAQRGAARLDLGPMIGVVVPVGHRAVRLSADWRQRIAGDARPGSGPALTIGSDF